MNWKKSAIFGFLLLILPAGLVRFSIGMADDTWRIAPHEIRELYVAHKPYQHPHEFVAWSLPEVDFAQIETKGHPPEIAEALERIRQILNRQKTDMLFDNALMERSFSLDWLYNGVRSWLTTLTTLGLADQCEQIVEVSPRIGISSDSGRSHHLFDLRAELEGKGSVGFSSNNYDDHLYPLLSPLPSYRRREFAFDTDQYFFELEPFIMREWRYPYPSWYPFPTQSPFDLFSKKTEDTLLADGYASRPLADGATVQFHFPCREKDNVIHIVPYREWAEKRVRECYLSVDQFEALPDEQKRMDSTSYLPQNATVFKYRQGPQMLLWYYFNGDMEKAEALLEEQINRPLLEEMLDENTDLSQNKYEMPELFVLYRMGRSLSDHWVAHAEVLVTMGKKEEALKLLEDALALEKRRSGRILENTRRILNAFYLRMAKITYLDGSLDEAMTWLEKFQPDDDNTVMANENCSMSLLAAFLGNAEDVKRLLALDSMKREEYDDYLERFLLALHKTKTLPGADEPAIWTAYLEQMTLRRKHLTLLQLIGTKFVAAGDLVSARKTFNTVNQFYFYDQAGNVYFDMNTNDVYYSGTRLIEQYEAGFRDETLELLNTLSRQREAWYFLAYIASKWNDKELADKFFDTAEETVRELPQSERRKNGRYSMSYQGGFNLNQPDALLHIAQFALRAGQWERGRRLMTEVTTTTTPLPLPPRDPTRGVLSSEADMHWRDLCYTLASQQQLELALLAADCVQDDTIQVEALFKVMDGYLKSRE